MGSAGLSEIAIAPKPLGAHNFRGAKRDPGISGTLGDNQRCRESLARVFLKSV
jgi:hypothetical protein